MINEEKGGILIVSGPSGCGKSTLLKEVYKNVDNYYFSISTTTRNIRKNESHGVDYFYISKKEFKEDIKNGHFLEWAKVHDNYYGTSLKPIMKALKKGKLVIFDIDVQGHEIVRKKLNHLVSSVFITTPTLTQLESRLKNRNTDTNEVINGRLENAQYEIKYFQKYDYIIINDDFKLASSTLLNIAQIARNKSTLYDKEDMLNKWSK